LEVKVGVDRVRDMEGMVGDRKGGIGGGVSGEGSRGEQSQEEEGGGRKFKIRGGVGKEEEKRMLFWNVTGIGNKGNGGIGNKGNGGGI